MKSKHPENESRNQQLENYFYYEYYIGLILLEALLRAHSKETCQLALLLVHQLLVHFFFV